MSTTTDRRGFLKASVAFLVSLSALPIYAERYRGLALASGTGGGGVLNFRRIYLDAALRERFFPFLQTVFHLYPENQLHQLILELASRYETDEEIYEALQRQLPSIKPLLGDLTYAIPALNNQKREMTRQTLQFLDPTRTVTGYLEIGSTGRYVSDLRHHVPIEGPIYIVNDIAPSYNPTDMLERGGVAKVGTYVPMGNYDPIPSDAVGDESLDLVTNFIGLHHCPIDRLDAFAHSIHRVLRPGGRLLHRDHDVDSPDMETLVALAHDVFNAGVWLPWAENSAQVRLFRSIPEWSRYLTSVGFVGSARTIAQANDPTRNLLLEFVKS
jgi:SAM-dependent methyltransferase